VDTVPTPKFKEQWVIHVDRKEYILTGEQMNALREKLASGDTGIIDFGDFAIKPSFVSSWSLHSRQIANQLTAPEKDDTLTEEQREKGRAKVAEIKQQHKRIFEPEGVKNEVPVS